MLLPTICLYTKNVQGLTLVGSLTLGSPAAKQKEIDQGLGPAIADLGRGARHVACRKSDCLSRALLHRLGEARRVQERVDADAAQGYLISGDW